MKYKFRALKDDISATIFVYGSLVYDNSGIPRITNDGGFLYTTCIKGTEQMWTGLCDKNGKEIYEGDIVLQPDYSGKTTSRVIFAYGCFYAGFHGGSSTIKRPKLLSKRSVVVGNIYEKEKPV